MRNMLKKSRFRVAKLGAAAAIIAAVVGVSMPSPASAAASSYVWTNGWANVRGCQSTDCYIAFQLWGPSKPPVDMICWIDGQWADGNYSTNRWFYIYAPTTGRYGYINASLVYNQIGVRSC